MPTTRMIRPQYTIQFLIGKIDMSMRVQSLAIVNSIKTVYPTILIKLNTSSKDYFLEKIYGQEDAKLKIVVTSEDMAPSENIDLDLIIIHMDNKVSSQKDTGKENTNETNQLEDSITLICLLKAPYKAFSTTINFIFSESKSKSSNQISDFEKITNEVNGGLINNPFQILDPVTTLDKVIDPITGLMTEIKRVQTTDPITGDITITSTRLQDNGSGILKEIIETKVIPNVSNVIEPIISNVSNKIIGPLSRISHNITGGNGGFGIGTSGNGSAKLLTDSLNKLRKNNPTAEFAASTNKSSGGRNTPINMISDLFDKYIKNSGVQKNIDFNNSNNIELKQLVIPPKSLIGCIRYINDRYSVYKGPMMIFSGIDNSFDMWDLSKASSKDILYTVDFIALGMEDSDILRASSESDNRFYTYYPLKVKNKSNSSAMSKGYDHIVVTHPRNKFSEIIKKSLDDVVSNFSVVENPKLFFNETAKLNKTVHSNINAASLEDDSDSAFLTSKLSGYITSLSTFTFKLKGTKLPLKKLSKVGSCIELIPHVTEYLNFSGKYIVGSSVVVLSREIDAHYTCTAEVTCFRESLES